MEPEEPILDPPKLDSSFEEDSYCGWITAAYGGGFAPIDFSKASFLSFKRWNSLMNYD